MTTATVRVSLPTRDRLRDLAKRLGTSMQVVLEEAVKAYRHPESDAGSKFASKASNSFAEDPNVLAYEALNDEFLADNAGKWVAFYGGSIVAACADRRELLTILDQRHPAEPCLIKELTLGKPRIVQFRRPRRMTRTGNLDTVRLPASPGMS